MGLIWRPRHGDVIDLHGGVRIYIQRRAGHRGGLELHFHGPEQNEIIITRASDGKRPRVEDDSPKKPGP